MAPLKESEALGNDLARFAAEMFVKSLDLGFFPVAESSAPSRNPNRWYPKMWDLSEWQEILSRPDVDFVDFPMCAYGLGPPDDPHAFYQHQEPKTLQAPPTSPHNKCIERRAPYFNF